MQVLGTALHAKHILKQAKVTMFGYIIPAKNCISQS
jgi:hypothetical protein